MSTNNNWTTHHIPVSGNLDQLLNSEWLLTNGTGAFSMGSAAAINTRRYHGLLVASTHPPVGRITTLNQVLERLILTRKDTEQTLDFGSCLFRNNLHKRVIAPGGESLLRSFEKGLTAKWQYSWGDITFTRELFLHFKQQAITLQYTIAGLEHSMTIPHASARLELRPLITLRDFHHLLNHQHTGPYNANIMANQFTLEHDHQSVTLHCSAGRFIRNREWWYNIYYPADELRGEHPFEDYIMPGWFEVPVHTDKQTTFSITATLGGKPVEQPDTSAEPRALHLTPIVDHITPKKDSPAGNDPMLRKTLAIAADDFIVERKVKQHNLATIIAGYPWFSDWGRDTFIALPGLLLTTGRYDEARHTLLAFAEAIQKGLVPNRFDDYDESAAHYNTVDASLWFIHAAIQYLNTTHDHDAWNDWLRDAALSIIDNYQAGTDGPINMTDEGLITAGNRNTQLTWMDAANSGVVFTPRSGKAVEINALWYNALVCVSEKLADNDTEKANQLSTLAKQVKVSFIKAFWDNTRKCLVDHIWTDDEGNEHNDKALRPNQIFAVALPHSPLSDEQKKSVIKIVRDKLLTPFGLRTLPTSDPNYHGKYIGNMFDRDKAYHQGTAWGWLIGPYAEAVLRAGNFSPDARNEAFQAIKPLIQHLLGQNEYHSPGQIHEIFEADPPHWPAGCIAQAWSVAEVLRTLRLIETN